MPRAKAKKVGRQSGAKATPKPKASSTPEATPHCTHQHAPASEEAAAAVCNLHHHAPPTAKVAHRAHRHAAAAAGADHAYLDHCVAVLREAGARVTQPRLAVLGILAGAVRPMGPRQLLEAMRADRGAPDVDQVTIYRMLETFTRLGLVHQIGPSGEFVACSHLSCSSPLHIFARCIDCGSYEELDLPADIMLPVQQYLFREVGFEPREHLLSVSGACAACRTSKGRRAPPTK